MSELTHDEFDLVVMGHVMAASFQSSTFRDIEKSRSLPIHYCNLIIPIMYYHSKLGIPFYYSQNDDPVSKS